MSVFNSLGSNYDLKFVIQTFFARNYSSKLRRLLEEKYKGKAVLLYKGRHAIELALKLSDLPKNSRIAINGFSCYALYQAIKNAGFTPVYLDISKKDLNFSAQTLKNKMGEIKGIKAVIIQNTLGYTSEASEIKKICLENDLVLIEDLAHSYGSVYRTGENSGDIGDFVVLSFSQDKIIDAISGGALIIRNEKFLKNIPKLDQVKSSEQIKDRLYPMHTYLIRKFYSIGFGKAFHKILKTFDLMTNPMVDIDSLQKLPGWYSYLAFKEITNLNKNLDHRRKIARIYLKNLNEKVLIENVKKNLENSSNLRFPIVVENREFLIEYLKKRNIYVSDIWYDGPISPKKNLSKTNYRHECLVAEEVSDLILNLPTHRNVSEKEAERIVKEVNKWLN